MDDAKRVKLSALWAAYGDALGFISELADEDGLRYRTRGVRVTKPVAWRRRIGGKFGATVELPAGTYSDDTQLRLAVARAIRGDGRFDVEAFAKVELPVWLSYALGAGRGTKAAAASLARENITWATNFYEEGDLSYLASGGNGAAMRIQPHVWAARDRTNMTYLPDVIRDAVCTHGHPRAILGSIFHALCVASALESGLPPSPDDWQNYIRLFAKVPDLMLSDKELRDLWLPLWERKTSKKFTTACEEVVAECAADLKDAVQMPPSDERTYREYVMRIGGLSKETRGSGTKTAIIAAVLAWYFREDADHALLIAANLLQSDTDTIATMAGAILGACTNREPEGEIQDRKYLMYEASRLSDISNKRDAESFPYPDLLTWRAPKTQSDAIAKVNGRILVCGLGFAEPLDKKYVGKGRSGPIWQWFQLKNGQTVLAKRREDIEVVGAENLPVEPTVPPPQSPWRQKDSLFDASILPRRSERIAGKGDQRRPHPVDLHQLTREAIDSDFSPLVIGRHLLALSDEEGGIERCIAYAAIIAKARRSRIDAARRKG